MDGISYVTPVIVYFKEVYCFGLVCTNLYNSPKRTVATVFVRNYPSKFVFRMLRWTVALENNEYRTNVI